MKKYLVIGKPIDHSLSPDLHNYWIKKYKIDALYEKKKITEVHIENLLNEVRKKKINGINVTVPFKKTVIPYLDKLTLEAKSTQSVNTIYLYNNEIIGHNTDIEGFEISCSKIKYDITNKEVFILGSGGVVPSIIFALKKMKVSKITISNRTKNKAEGLKNLFKDLNIVDWGVVPHFDIIINATSIGLDKDDVINLDFSNSGKDKFFYDVIYNPKETNFLKKGKYYGNLTQNGKMMFIHQASAAFKIWHGIEPIINDEIIELLNK